MRDVARGLHRKHEAIRRLLRPGGKGVWALHAVECAVDLDSAELARGVGQLLLVRQPLGIEHAPPRRVSPAGNTYPNCAATRHADPAGGISASGELDALPARQFLHRTPDAEHHWFIE